MGILPARVLLDLPNWLGDFIHALPPLARLCACNGGGETWVTLPPAHAPLAQLTGAQTIPRPMKASFRWARRVLRGRFEIALTLRHSTRAKLLLAGTGAAFSLASAGRGASALGHATFRVGRSQHQRHDLDEALARLGLPTVGDDPFVVKLPPSWTRGGRRQRMLLAERRPLVALLPGSRSVDKRYPLEGYAAVARGLARHGVASVVLVGPGEEALASAIAAVTQARIAPTTWPLDVTAALLAACDSAVGNDSGLTHLAALVGCPTVALFGPTDPARTAPVGVAVTLRAGQQGCAGWLAEIEPPRIARELLALLPSPRVGAARMQDRNVLSDEDVLRARVIVEAT
jgi:heptosyltransferase-2